MFEPLLGALETRYSFFLLGAGASAGMVPFTKDFSDSIKKGFLDYGVFSTNQINRDQTSTRVLGDIDPEPKTINDELMNRIYNNYTLAKVMKEMVPKRVEKCFSNYHIFNYSTARPLILFNMNTDGIAKRICKGHFLIEAHGFIPYNLVHSKFYDQHLDDLLLYPDLRTFNIPGLLLPQSEPKDITNRKEYLLVEHWFSKVPCFVVIGYSFGKHKGSIDDLETFEFFRRLLRKYPKQVIIIDPYPEVIAATIQDATHLRQVITISALWNHLSSALIDTALRSHCSNILELKSLKKETIYRYDELCDISQ